MTEEPPTPQDDETPAADADAPAGGSTEGAEAAAEGQAQGGADQPEAAGGADQPAAEGDAPAGDEPVETPAGDTTSADEPGGATAEGINAPDEPAQAPDVVGPEGAEEAGGGAEAGAQAAGVDEGPDAETAERRERPKPSARKQARRQAATENEPEVVPGAHLEPDLVLESDAQEAQDEYGAYAQTYDAGTVAEDETADGRPAEPAGETDGVGAQPQPERKVLDLAADARYPATGKRKTSVARVILKPGTGTYTINGRPLEVFFPRAGLQRQARQPLETAGYDSRMDVVARIHGGGVSAQAGALRHGIARALVEADPALRTELKRRGFLTRDARVKERKKAGLKKARKRPQFSKR
jgi:small subunit ribosomal protein S9